MMRKVLFTIIFLLCAGLSFIPTKGVFSSSGRVDLPPILDNGVDPSLKFSSCLGEKDAPLEWNKLKRYYQVPDSITKKIKSKKITEMQESWRGGGHSVTIDRWYFDCPEDAIFFPWSNMVLQCSEFPGWADKADVGDKTFWLISSDMFFVKGNVLVRVFVTPIKSGDAETRQYTLKIAKYIESKLP